MSRSTRPGKYAEEEQAIADLREALKQRFPLPDPPPPRKKRLNATRAGLLSLALLAGLAGFDPAYRSEHYLTHVGQRQTLQLADGSEVVLDSASELTVSWHLLSRRSELVRGQALFAVAPRVYRPFLVEAGPAAVRVVGTCFNVSRPGPDVRVTVEEGRVEVRAGDASSLLQAGQQVRVHDGHLEPLAQVDARQSMAWRNGELVFESTPLAEVIEVIQRYHAMPIRLGDPALGRLPVSGVFDSAHVERLLGLLPSILPLTVSNAADGSVLIVPRGKK